MITTNLFVDACLVLPLLGGAPEPQAPQVTFEAPTMYVVGLPFEVEVTIEASAEGGSAAAWWLTPAGFLINDEPAQRRDGDALVPLAPGTSLTVKFDLAPFISTTDVQARRFSSQRRPSTGMQISDAPWWTRVATSLSQDST